MYQMNESLATRAHLANTLLKGVTKRAKKITFSFQDIHTVNHFILCIIHILCCNLINIKVFKNAYQKGSKGYHYVLSSLLESPNLWKKQ